VVESCLGVPTGCVGKLRWQTTGMFGDATMAQSWDGVGEAAMVEPIWHKRGLLGGCDAHTGGENSGGHYKLDETIEQSCSDFLAHTLEVCKGAHRYNEYLAIQG
jgi:hypothetical protein